MYGWILSINKAKKQKECNDRQITRIIQFISNIFKIEFAQRPDSFTFSLRMQTRSLETRYNIPLLIVFDTANVMKTGYNIPITRPFSVARPTLSDRINWKDPPPRFEGSSPLGIFDGAKSGSPRGLCTRKKAIGIIRLVLTNRVVKKSRNFFVPRSRSQMRRFASGAINIRRISARKLSVGDWSWQLFAWRISTTVPLFFLPFLETIGILSANGRRGWIGSSRENSFQRFWKKYERSDCKTMVENYGRQVRFHLRAASLRSPATIGPVYSRQYSSIDLFIDVCRRIRSEVSQRRADGGGPLRVLSRILAWKTPVATRVQPSPHPFSSSFLFLLFPRAQTKTAYLRLPVPTRVNTFTPRPPNRPPLRLSSTRPPFFPFSHHSGGPFTGAARVAFEVRSRPKESVKDWFPAPPSTSTPAYYGRTPSPAAILPRIFIPCWSSRQVFYVVTFIVIQIRNGRSALIGFYR